MSDLIFGSGLYDAERWDEYCKRVDSRRVSYRCEHGVPIHSEVCNACGDALAEVCAKVHAEDVAESPRRAP